MLGKGIGDMRIDNEALSPVLRILLAQTVPESVRHVGMTVPQTSAGKFMFHVARHVLDLANYETATIIDLQRLQMCSQLLGLVRYQFPVLISILSKKPFSLRRLKCGCPIAA